MTVITDVATTVRVPFAVEQDEDGVWCAHAWFGPGRGAHGDGRTRDAAIADLRLAVALVLSDGIPDIGILEFDVA